jgi:hypothetical protein
LSAQTLHPSVENFWKDIIREEREDILNGGTPLTIAELLQKLAECRSRYPILNGN